VGMAERGWNKRQLVAYTAAHRAPRVVWTSSTHRTRGGPVLISGFLDEDFVFSARAVTRFGTGTS
jgi:hypothetical protein